MKAVVRWATGKRLTNRLPKLSLITAVHGILSFYCPTSGPFQESSILHILDTQHLLGRFNDCQRQSLQPTAEVPSDRPQLKTSPCARRLPSQFPTRVKLTYGLIVVRRKKPDKFDRINRLRVVRASSNMLSSITLRRCCTIAVTNCCLLYTSPSPRDGLLSRMPSSA